MSNADPPWVKPAPIEFDDLPADEALSPQERQERAYSTALMIYTGNRTLGASHEAALASATRAAATYDGRRAEVAAAKAAVDWQEARLAEAQRLREARMQDWRQAMDRMPTVAEWDAGHAL